MEDQTKSYIFIFLSVILWGTVPAISKLTLKNLDFYQLTTYSLFFAAITLFIIVCFQKKVNLFREYSKSDYIHMIQLGFVGVFATYMLYFGGINFATAADGAILNNTWQIFAIIFAFFILREKLTPRRVIALTLGFIGAYIVITKGSFLSINPLYTLGYVLALGSGITEGLFTILGKKYHYETFTSMAIYCAVSFVFVLITTLIFSSLAVPSLIGLIGVIYLGAFGIALPYAFLFRAMKLGDTAKVTSIGYLSPVFALVSVFLLLGDKIFVSQILGLLLILIGILIVSLNKKRSPKKAKTLKVSS